jgi:peptidoglycan hydrolase-like protein with peptidoglycan-binding domain
MRNGKSLLLTVIVACLSATPISVLSAPAADLAALKSSDYTQVSQRIKMIQRKLQLAGFQPGTVDGIFGPTTSRAISHYQKKHGLPQSGYPDQRFLEDLHKRVPEKPK